MDSGAAMVPAGAAKVDAARQTAARMDAVNFKEGIAYMVVKLRSLDI